MRQLTVRAEIFPIRGSFRIARGERTEAHVVVAEITDGTHRGRGECVPYGRYGESVEGVLAAIEAV
ncbi:MAG: dipeptide epimerase, partial [Pseudomonadota bacterium]